VKDLKSASEFVRNSFENLSQEPVLPQGLLGLPPQVPISLPNSLKAQEDSIPA